MKKIVAIIQARMGSTRFPNKVLENLLDKPILKWVTERASQISNVDKIVVATSDQKADDAIVDFCQKNNVEFFRGSEKNVLSRFYNTALHHKADIIIRLTADCPLLDPSIINQVLYLVKNVKADYACNTFPATWPDGLDCEVFTFKALEYAFKNASRASDLEHVTPYIRNNQHLFKVKNLNSPDANLSKHRWTVDSPEDLDYINQIIRKTNKDLSTWNILETIDKNPDIKQPDAKRNEGFDKSLKEETVYCTQFTNSHKLLDRSLKSIPLGSQTFSKSYIQYPKNTSPLFLTHGIGAKVWDVDGNEYVDLVSGLMPVVLGYNDLDVNYAIQDQLNKGICFSMATELEIKLADKLCQIIPSCEKVRFAKNGTDVTSAAVRLARSYTKKDKIIVCGYHGWQDWYIGTTSRNKGIPKAVSDLSSSVPYNDLNALEELLKTKDFAGIVMEPCNVASPKDNYLKNAKDLCEKYGSLLIFDEVITGFRFSLGGAQEYFNVTPHLSCFGKAMGNGMPISAIVGQDHIMKEMEEIFFSGTFGGESLSIVAALSTIDKIINEKVIDHLWDYGINLSEEIEKIIVSNNLQEIIKLVGYAPWKMLQFFDNSFNTSFTIKTLFIQEMIKRGVLINASLNINFSHRQVERLKIINAFKDTFAIINEALKKDISCYLQNPVIQPLFKVR